MTVKLNRIAVGAGVFAAGMVFAAWLPSATAQHSGDVSGSEGSLLPFESQITRISIPMRRDSTGHWRGRVVFDDGRAQEVAVETVPTLFGTGEHPIAVRPVVATVFRGKSIPAATLASAMAQNHEMGSFRVEEQSGEAALVYRIDVPESTGPGFLDRAVLTAALMADEMEERLQSGRDAL